MCTGKSDAKGEEPVDWSFAVLELLREQGWDVKEMNDRWRIVVMPLTSKAFFELRRTEIQSFSIGIIR